MKKLISWNVDGIRAFVKKGFLDYFYEIDEEVMGSDHCPVELTIKDEAHV